MFQFSGFASYTYVFSAGWPAYAGRVSPFGNSRIKVSLQTPRDLSHATTSFFASYRLGIHRMRLFTWPYNPNQSVGHTVHFMRLSLHSSSVLLPVCRVICASWHFSLFLLENSFKLTSFPLHIYSACAKQIVCFFSVRLNSLVISIVLFYKVTLLQISKLLKSY